MNRATMFKLTLSAMLIFGINARVHGQDKPKLKEITFLKSGTPVDTTGLGDITVELVFDQAMNTSVDPVVNFGLEPPYELNVPAKGKGWVDPKLWQGFFTVSQNNPQTGDGRYVFKISGAQNLSATEMDITLSTDLGKTLYICRGGELEVQTGLLNFDTIQAGDPATRTLLLTNASCAALEIDITSVPTPFSVVNSSLSFTLPGGGTRELTVRFAPTERRHFERNLVIQSTDRRQAVRQVVLVGTARGPKIELSPSVLVDFGSVEIDSFATRTVTVRNPLADAAGLSDTLRVNRISTTLPDIYQVEPEELVVPPGGSETVQVTFTPNEARRFEANLLFESNDLVRPNRSLELDGDARDTSPSGRIPSLEVTWAGYSGFTRRDSLSICWDESDDPSGIAEVWWKFVRGRVPPQNASDTTEAGGRTGLSEGATCAVLPLVGRLSSGFWYCYVWLVDGSGNSGYENAVETFFVYDTTPPGEPTLLSRSIPFGRWFGALDVFQLTIEIPEDPNRGVRDAAEVRWKYKTPPNSGTDFSGKRIPGDDNREEFTFTVPFNAPSLCGEDTLYFWLADSAGNSNPESAAMAPYRFDVCAPEITRLAPADSNIAVLAKAFTDTLMITDHAGVDTAWVRYRFGGAEAEEPPKPVLRVGESDSFALRIPAAGVTRRGLEYRVVARDILGHEAKGPQGLKGGSDEEGWFPIRTRVEGEGDFRIDPDGRALPLVASDDKTNYQLISVPYELDADSLEAVVMDDLGEYNPRVWRFFDYKADNPTDSTRWLEGTDARGFAPGRAFFIATRRHNVVLDSGPGQTRRTVCPDTLRLYEGWNLVATPFNFPVHKSALQIIARGVADLPITLHSYERGWNIIDVMEPWRGYALYVPKIEDAGADTNVYLIVQPKAAAGRLEKSAEPVASTQQGEWRIQIAAEARTLHDRENFAGVLHGAAKGFDRLERAEPPVIGKYLRVSFTRSTWQQAVDRFSTDFRPPENGEQVWEFEVATNLADEQVEIRFDVLGDLPPGTEVYLFDEAAGIARNLRSTPVYTFAAGRSGVRKKLKLVVGGEAFVSQAGGMPLVPEAFELQQNFPNPFNPSTTIRYTLPEEARVTLVIYDLLGRQVRTLLRDAQHNAGYHTAVWDGRDDAGRPVASGVYLYRIEAGAHQGTRKMVLVK